MPAGARTHAAWCSAEEHSAHIAASSKPLHPTHACGLQAVRRIAPGEAVYSIMLRPIAPRVARSDFATWLTNQGVIKGRHSINRQVSHPSRSCTLMRLVPQVSAA